MGEISLLIKEVKSDKEKFYLLLQKMEPLIKKYERLLFMDEKEDIHSELTLALWEAVCRIRTYENEGQAVNYLRIALRNKFLELYRSSRRIHDNTTCCYKEEVLENITFIENMFNDAIIKEDIKKLLEKFTGNKKKIFYFILVENLSDIEIAEKMDLSRQYINRVRKHLQELFKNIYS